MYPFRNSGSGLLIISGLILFTFAHKVCGQDGTCKSVLRPPLNGVYVVAHRGAHKGIPENSLAAYQKAIDLGCDFVEIDVRTTKDGRYVSIHNSKVDDYAAGAAGNVSEMTFEEIRALDIGRRLGPEWKGTRIPSFEEILDLCQGKIGIYLDLKDASVAELVGIIRKYRMERDIIWYITSDRTRELSELSENCPDCLPVPDPGKEGNVSSVIIRFKASLIATDMGELSGTFVSTAHRGNALVIADELKGTEDEWSRMIEWKTDGIQSDDPEKLILFLKSRKKP